MFLLSSLWSKLKTALLVLTITLTVLLGIYKKVRSDAVAEVQAKAQKELIKHIKTKKKVDDEVSSLDRDGLADRMRDKWSKG